VVGWLHGILFIGFLTLAFLYKEDNKLSWRWLIGAGMAALLPFGPFVWERRYLQPVAEESRR
jgi:integral membrane protein